MPEMVANFRGNIDWNNLKAIVDQCSQAAKAKG